MRKLVFVISLIVVFTFGMTVQSQVEVSESNIWETSVFKEPIKSQKAQIDDDEKETAIYSETIVAFIIVENFIQYDAQVLSEGTTLMMSAPTSINKSFIEEDYFKIKYRQDGLSTEYPNEKTVATEGILALVKRDFFESTITAESAIRSLAFNGDNPYKGVGYFVQPNVQFALGWNTQKPFNQLKSLL
jgi:hypothetical protein